MNVQLVITKMDLVVILLPTAGIQVTGDLVVKIAVEDKRQGQ
jgi:hypothetical protein